MESSHQSESGRAEIQTDSSSQLYGKEETKSQQVWMSHGDHAEQLPEGFTVAATSEKACLPPDGQQNCSNCIHTYQLKLQADITPPGTIPKIVSQSVITCHCKDLVAILGISFRHLISDVHCRLDSQ